MVITPYGGCDELSEFLQQLIEMTYNTANAVSDLLMNIDIDTMEQKVEGYLLSIGVTAEEIASIRHIFLG